MHGLILLAHGSRDPAWADPLRDLTQRVAARRDGPVVLAYLELAEPAVERAIDDLVAAGADPVTVVPVFLGAGQHLKADLPPRLDACRSRHPGVTIVQAPPIGESEAVLDALAAAIVGEPGPGAAGT
jgi:sirohydrochlorin cobaltochelatase